MPPVILGKLGYKPGATMVTNGARPMHGWQFTVYKTHIDGLGFAKIAPGHWQFIALDTFSQRSAGTVGPIYPSKAVLLADMVDYAKRAGWLNDA